jgi:fumarate reductase subunit D
MGKFESVMWGLFAATSTLAAIFIPIHIIATEFVPSLISNTMGQQILAKMLSSYAFKVYIFIIIASAIYHGMYRFKAFLHDIGLIKLEKYIEPILYALGFIFPIISIVLLII